MRALTIGDGAGDRLRLEDVPEPSPQEGSILVQAIALGICGTDRRLVRTAPRLPLGMGRLVMGHESLGRVLDAPRTSGFAPGDLVVATVRGPDPAPCPWCASGQPDLCENDGFTERGIRGRDGFGSERFRLRPADAVRVDPSLGLAGVLVEPASIVSKAWERLGSLAQRRPGRALVLGAGPIGLLAALMGAERGYAVHVLDQLDLGPKPGQVRALGAVYHTSAATLAGPFDVVLECTGALFSEAVRQTAPLGTTCLIGEGPDRSAPAWGPEDLTSDLILGNKTVVGIVSSNRRHFETAHRALCRADPAWLAGLLEPCVPLQDWPRAFQGGEGQIKAVINFSTLPAVGPAARRSPGRNGGA